ncbi:MAG: PEP-CTERM sorting domain-containing protein [Kiritimatiellae bacterium]|nr:PEP-CTERM sorting domain-containing protein [Kiritimatiellia bacterium]
MKKTGTWIGMAVFAGMVFSASGDLLTNPSFELGTGQGGALQDASVTDWVNYAGIGWWASDAGAVYDGTYAIKRWDNDTGIYSDFSATPGITYNFSLWCYDDNSQPLVDRYVELKAEWLDAGYGQLGSTVIGQFNAGTVDTWTQLSGQSEAVAGTVHGRIVITTAGGASAGGAVYYDLASVTQVPEPNVLALFGIGLAAVTLFRRKMRR